MEILSPDELEAWVKEEYHSLSGKALTDEYMDYAVIKQFAHGGMSSGRVDNTWWMEEGIPLLKNRLAGCDRSAAVKKDPCRTRLKKHCTRRQIWT